MGIKCSKPSAVDDSPNNRLSSKRVNRLNSSKRDEGVRLNSSKRNKHDQFNSSRRDGLRLNSSRRDERLNSSRRDEGLRLNSSKREEGMRLNSLRISEGGSSQAKLDTGDLKVALLDKKVNGSTRIHDDQIEIKKKENLGSLFADYPGKGSVPKAVEGEQVAAGWPAWLSNAAGEAIKGWLPRRADTFEKLEKIGQGTYSSVYKARDIIQNKLVALKRVRFDNLDKESVKFMAREILILRILDHPNIIKLEGLITSPRSCSLYLVFEYMEHDLTGLASRPGVKFTEPQVKCYMEQLLRGLDYCHRQGVLHRDIKGSNLLIDDNGILKIADLGLASFFDPHNNVPLTNRVVTLWYRPLELLLGASHYGVAVDLWSAGCILAELYTGKPILPGKTEVEQLHKIFKLCGSPSEEYWRKLKLPHSTAFKPTQPYRRCVSEAFKEFPAAAVALLDTLLSIDPAHRGTAALALKSEFFKTKPLACDPSSLPKYPATKEIDAKVREDGGGRHEKIGSKDQKVVAEGRRPKESRDNLSPNTKAELLGMSMQGRKGHSSTKIRSELFNPRGDEPVSGFLIGPRKQKQTQKSKDTNKDSDRFSHSGPLIHGPAWTKSGKVLDDPTIPSRANLTTLSGLVATRITTSEDHGDRPGPSQPESRNQVGRLFDSSNELESARKQDRKRYTQRVADSYQIDHGKASAKEPTMHVSKGNKIYVSGPLLGPSNNVDKILKEHDRRIQEYARQARHGKHNTQVKQGPATRTHI